MTGAEFMELWADRELRQYIVDEARRHSKRPDIQEEHIQEAWLCLSCAPAGHTIVFYQDIIHRAIYSSYWQQYKEQIMVGGHINVQGAVIAEEQFDRGDNDMYA